MLKSVLGPFTLSRVLIALFAVSGYFLLPTVREGVFVPLTEPDPWFLSLWYQWDAHWYMSIVMDGYQWLSGDQSNVAFFPLYPLSAKVLGAVMGGRYLLAGLALSLVFLAGGMMFFYRLVLADYGADVARRSVLLLAIFPTSVFFSTMYTESLFLMTSVATFYYARKGRWALAGGWGLLASLTRITGLWLFLPLAWELLSQKQLSVRELSRRAPWLILVPGGTVLFMLYLNLEFGRPFAFAETQVEGWGHGTTIFWTSLLRDLSFLLEQSELWVIYEFGAVALLLLCMVAGLKKLPGSYNIYMLVSLAVPLFGGTTKSMSRYLLVVFPMFIVMAIYTKKPAMRYTVYAVSLMLLALATAAFASGRWVA